MLPLNEVMLTTSTKSYNDHENYLNANLNARTLTNLFQRHYLGLKALLNTVLTALKKLFKSK